jgi:hypothetical protein
LLVQCLRENIGSSTPSQQPAGLINYFHKLPKFAEIGEGAPEFEQPETSPVRSLPVGDISHLQRALRRSARILFAFTACFAPFGQDSLCFYSVLRATVVSLYPRLALGVAKLELHVLTSIAAGNF